MTPDNDQDTADMSPSQAPGERPARAASPEVQVEVGALSHRGKVRPNNEDHFLVGRFGRSLEVLLTNLSPEFAIPRHAEIGYGMVVADGMGGEAGGEIASRSAIQDLLFLVLSTPDWVLNQHSPWIEEVMQRMAERFREIDRFIRQRAAGDPDLYGMGTTMTLACSLGLELVLCHIGDSRAYLFREGSLAQLTRDMTMAQELIDAGRLSPTQAATHRFRHVLTQCLGAPGTAKADVRHVALRDGDRLLLCSDGLYEMVGDAQIADTVRGAPTAQAGCQTLVDRALEAGGKDNITVVLARYKHAPWVS